VICRIAGSARFRLGEDEKVVAAGSVVVLRDPAVRRSATALTAGTTVLAIGAPARDGFDSTWNASHFEGIERLPD
jgi:hypothetical protein